MAKVIEALRVQDSGFRGLNPNSLNPKSLNPKP